DGERSRTVRATGRNTEQLRYYHTDALGSVTAITDGDGKIIEANIYGPFGETEFSYKATLHKVNPEKRAELLVDPFLYSSDNRYTYTGQEQDEFGGLIYYNARWYDAEVGRFISEDPAAANPNDPLSINRYIYCRNNPLIYTDPTGEIFGIDDFVFILICAVVAGVGNTIDAMTNPKNQWHGGNYNDAFWHGFGQGATAGSAIIGAVNFCQGVAAALSKITAIESNGFLDWAKQASDIVGAEKVSGTYLGKTYEDGIAKCSEDAVKYSSALISGKGGKGGTSQFFTKLAGSVNPFTNDYFRNFYNITVGNAYDMYTGQTRDIYKLYLVSATQIWGGKYIDVSIAKTELVDMNLFSKGAFNYLTGNLINGSSINRHDAVNSGLEQANPLIISTSLFGNIHYSHYVKAVEDLSRL
ncbi:protein Rhs family, partial [Candidatus Termititenax aidoneus]